MPTPVTAPRTERVVYQGQPAWIKRPEPARSSRFVWLHKLFIPLLPMAMRPTNSGGGTEGLASEVSRLKVFAKAGLPVPEILEQGRDYVILPDCGAMLYHHITALNDPADRLKWVQKALDVLLAVHHAGLTHGRPYFKDFVINPNSGKITMLDLEEDSTQSAPLADAQARDFWLFLTSACDFFAPQAPFLAGLVDYYCANAPRQSRDALPRLGRALRPYRRLIGLLHAQNIAREVTGAYWASRALEALPKP